MYRELAYGPLNLTPEQFWSSTPRTINELYAGYQQREDHRIQQIDQRIGYLLVHLLQPYAPKGKTLQLQQFIPKTKQRPREAKTRAEQRSEINTIKERMS